MPQPSDPSFFAIALSASVVRRSIRIALVVGIVIALINHADKMMTGHLTGGTLLKIALTFLVPYCVSTYSSVLAVRERRQSIDSKD